MTLSSIEMMINRMASEPLAERQHTMEYYLYKHFIRYVAALAPEPYQTLATAILRTEDLHIGTITP